MTPFSTLSAAIQTKLESLAACAGVSIIQDDAEDVGTEVNKAIASIGMMILLSVPGFKNKDATLSNVVNADLKIQVLVRETPSIWRRKSNNNPIHCADLGQAIAPAVQGLVIPGFEDLRVLNGEPLGNFAAQLGNGKQITFQDYVLQIETMQVFAT